MRFASVALFLLAATLPIFGAPSSSLTVEKANGQTSGKYIVTLKEGIDKTSLVSHVKTTAHVTDEWSVINGFAAHLDTATLDFLRAHSDVASIAEDGMMSIDATITQTNAPWGLQRISQAAPLGRTDTGSLTFTYPYDSSAGTGVNIYIVDTGIYTAHSTFQGRAVWGATFGGYASADGNGHGTHVAGTSAGYDYGVAKAAHLIAVKVLSDSGSGFVSDIVSGLNWVQSQVAATGRPSIVSMSLGGGASTSLDSAVASLTNSGIHVVVAAGNSNTDASSTSPARAPSALTVGASDITDTRASFSNYGAPVKVFAPGVNVISSWIGSTTATNNISGTSMATPHVTGIVAYLIGLSGNLTPASMIAKVQSLAVKGILKNIPAGTVNYLAQY
ncbi:serine protease [Amanita muscaria]